MAEPKSYILKLYMPGTRLYRVFEAPGYVTLEELNRHIHEYMEFPTYEMYAFFPDNKLFSQNGYYAPQMRRKSTAQVRLEQLKLQSEQRILYLYDMEKLYQFYLRVEEVRPGYVDAIRLLRREGHLDDGPRQETPSAQELGPDTWIVRGSDEAMEHLAASNEREALLATAYSMSLEVMQNWSRARIAEAIVEKLLSQEQIALRMLTLESIHILNAVWRAQDGQTLTFPFEMLERLSLLGFIGFSEEENTQVLTYSRFGREWFNALLEAQENLVRIDTYVHWTVIARGILQSYGVVQMDDFYRLMQQYIGKDPDVSLICDFMMQRMEWNGVCEALQDDENWYWSMVEPEQAQRILSRRRLYDLSYKPLSYKEICENAESAGWQNIDCGQELIAALQGLAKSPEENKTMLNGIVDAFIEGLEPHEAIERCLPPISQMGRSAYAKIRRILRKVRRQLPNYGLMGYSQEEAEAMFPDRVTAEGFTVIRGQKE